MFLMKCSSQPDSDVDIAVSHLNSVSKVYKLPVAFSVVVLFAARRLRRPVLGHKAIAE